MAVTQSGAPVTGVAIAEGPPRSGILERVLARGSSPLSALLLLGMVTVVAMWPALSDISDTVMGSLQPSDATAGGVWLSWQLGHLSPFSARTGAVGAPQGIPFWLPTYVTALGWMLPMWAIAHITGPVTTWNILVGLGFLADGMAMYGLVRWLTGKGWYALFAGLLYAFSPFHMEQAYVHLAYLNSWIFPLLIWAGLVMLRVPRTRQAVVFGLAVAGAAYFDGYFIVFGPLVATVIALSGLIFSGLLGGQRLALLKASLAAAAVAVAGMIPIAVVYTAGSGSAAFNSYKGAYTLNISSAQVTGYVIPWVGSPAWARAVNGILGVDPGFRWGDGSLYLGWVVLALTAVLLALGLRRGGMAENGRLPVPPRFLAIAVPVAALAITLSSFARFGPIPGIPALVWTIKPLWRAYSRLDVAVSCLYALAAALALVFLRPRLRPALLLTIAALALVDATAIFPWQSWSYASNTPVAFAWLRAHPDGGTVMGYPVQRIPGRDAIYLTYQALNHHPLFNGNNLDPRHVALVRGMEGLSDPQTVPTLRREGVRYILLELRYANVSWVTHPVPGVSVVLTTPASTLLRVQAGPLAPAALTIGQGLTDRQYSLETGHWMLASTAQLGIVEFERGGLLRVAFSVRSYVRPSSGRRLSIYQGARLLWRGQVGRDLRRVRFLTRSTADITLRSNPGPTAVPGLQFPRAIELRRLSVEQAA